jgi:hypothetical protein
MLSTAFVAGRLQRGAGISSVGVIGIPHEILAAPPAAERAAVWLASEWGSTGNAGNINNVGEKARRIKEIKR